MRALGTSVRAVICSRRTTFSDGTTDVSIFYQLDCFVKAFGTLQVSYSNCYKVFYVVYYFGGFCISVQNGNYRNMKFSYETRRCC